MTHIWVRAEQRENEQRVGVTPEGVRALMKAGMSVTVEESGCRAIPIEAYRETGCAIAAEGSWPDAPKDAIIFGLKELPAGDSPLPHRHIMFGHAFKGQADGPASSADSRLAAARCMIWNISPMRAAAVSPPSATGRASRGLPSG